MAERSERDFRTREERERARLQDPEIQARIAEIKGRIARGEYGPTIPGEELRGFLDEQTRKALGTRST